MEKLVRILEIKRAMTLMTTEPQCTEEDHINADNLLTELLILLGHEDIVNDYNKISKWYA